MRASSHWSRKSEETATKTNTLGEERENKERGEQNIERGRVTGARCDKRGGQELQDEDRRQTCSVLMEAGREWAPPVLNPAKTSDSRPFNPQKRK